MQPHQNPLVEQIISAHRNRTAPDAVNWLGNTFTVMPTVFSPFIAPSGSITRCLASLIDFRGKRVWEVGCGAGLFSCSAALGGATNVVATDLSEEAIDNTNKNAKDLGVEATVSARVGRLFEPIRQGEIFDIVYADLPLVDQIPKDPLEMAFYDRNLDSLRELPSRVQEFLDLRNGTIYVCLSNLGPKKAIIDTFRSNLFDAESVLQVGQLHWITLELFRFTPCRR